MANRACAHCGETSLDAVKLALSGPQMPVRCAICGRYSTTPTGQRVLMVLGMMLSAVAAIASGYAWGEPVGLAVIVVGIAASLASGLRSVPPIAVFPEKSLVPPAMLAALVPAVVAALAWWSDGAWAWVDDAVIPVAVWWFTFAVLLVLGTPVAWLLRRSGRQDYGAYAVAGALPAVALVATALSAPANPKPWLVACGLGIATALAFRFFARRRIG